ncbi:MAG: putative hydroxymethylpyrimidine transporter CytX [Lachnospira sp.]|nr:putative hydroxymethylpyrimidine transporter CytX [Lachnospira sp.]
MSTERRTSLFENGLIWFGAGVSLAEILTGTYFAPLGMEKGIAAIVTGHVIGCSLLYLAGLIGGLERRSSMETVKLTFGAAGGLLFVILNIIQLAGWTAIMIYDGALAAVGALPVGSWIWCICIGALIIIWILIGVRNLGKLNLAAMSALFVLTIVLCAVIFSGSTENTGAADALSFGAAVELSASMPLSWLPCISDYTREAEKPRPAAAVSTLTYGLVSCWMFLIGMGAARYAGTTDIASIMVRAGLGVAGLVIIIFSTVTTTFLDAMSAGISAQALSGRISDRWTAVIVTVIGTVAAAGFPMDDITGFLYFIGSVFAPMIGVQIADYFILKNRDERRGFTWPALLVWLGGFILYRYFMTLDIPCGNTLPAVAVCVAAYTCVGKLAEKKKR